MMNYEVMEMQKKSNYVREEILNNFSVLLIGIVKTIKNIGVGNTFANQLIRTVTSPALNYGEAQSSESRRDFIHKMKKENELISIFVKSIDNANNNNLKHT
jgi:hypothetical protein